MTKLFALVTHPTNGQFMIMEYEVVRETPQYWFLQIRDIPNKKAMNHMFKVKKHTPDYFFSPDEAMQSFIKTQERKISDARRDIRISESEIERIKNELQVQNASSGASVS